MLPKILVLEKYYLYEDGLVFSIKRGKFLSQWINSNGYLTTKLNNRHWPIHQLLGLYFIANPLNLETVNHKDKDKLNNSLDNLEWMSREDNVKHGLQKSYKATSPEGVVVEFTGQADFCRLHNLTQANFSKMLLGERSTCKGWTRAA